MVAIVVFPCISLRAWALFLRAKISRPTISSALADDTCDPDFGIIESSLPAEVGGQAWRDRWWQASGSAGTIVDDAGDER